MLTAHKLKRVQKAMRNNSLVSETSPSGWKSSPHLSAFVFSLSWPQSWPSRTSNESLGSLRAPRSLYLSFFCVASRGFSTALTSLHPCSGVWMLSSSSSKGWERCVRVLRSTNNS